MARPSPASEPTASPCTTRNSSGTDVTTTIILSLGVNEESHFKNLAVALRREDWLNDSRYSGRAERKQHAAELATEIEQALAADTAENWEPIRQAAGVPAARLRSLPEALASDQVQARGFVQTTDNGNKVPTLPFRLGGASAYPPASSAPTLGQHTAEIEDWLNGSTD